MKRRWLMGGFWAGCDLGKHIIRRNWEVICSQAFIFGTDTYIYAYTSTYIYVYICLHIELLIGRSKVWNMRFVTVACRLVILRLALSVCRDCLGWCCRVPDGVGGGAIWVRGFSMGLGANGFVCGFGFRDGRDRGTTGCVFLGLF